MDITWHGLGCFRISERGYPALITDPFNEEETGLTLPRAKNEIVLSSAVLTEPETARWKGVRGPYRTLAIPGEYEIGGVFITAVNTYRDKKKGAQNGENLIYAINIKDYVICHLGALGHLPTQTQIEALGSVNILLLPVGLPDGLTPTMASEVVSLIEPNLVIPMQYHIPGLAVKRNPVSRFLKEMGSPKSDPQPSLKLTAQGELSEETQLLLLEPQKG